MKGSKKSRNVRLAVALVLTVGIVIFLVACGESGASHEAADSSSSSATEETSASPEKEAISPESSNGKPALWEGKTPQEYGCSDEDAALIYEYVVLWGEYYEHAYESTHEDCVINSYTIGEYLSTSPMKVCHMNFTLYGAYDSRSEKDGGHVAYDTIEISNRGELIEKMEFWKRQLAQE